MASLRETATSSRVGHVVRGLHRRYIRVLPREATLAVRRVRGSRLAHTPDFLVVGVQKGGTTALLAGLTASSAIGTPLLKEVHYFDRHRSRSFEWYRNHFWGDSPTQVWGESTPAYFDTPHLPGDIARALPHVKIVITLRDPLARAISHYFHAVEFGLESRSLGDAFADELALLAGRGWRSVDEFHVHGYLDRSRYSRSVRRWLDVLPSEQVLVVLAEQRAESLARAGRFVAPAADDLSVRESNVRPYRVPDGVDFGPAVQLLGEDCETLRQQLGWTEIPLQWSNILG